MEVTRVTVAVEDSSAVGEARRQAAALARRVGFTEEDETRVSIVASELATNLTRHARGDRWLLGRPTLHESQVGIELLALDSGPGIANLVEAERDGFSTSGGRGEGIGAVRRIADLLDVQSTPAGTVVLTRLYPAGVQPGADALGAVVVPLRGETASGDAWAAERDASARWLMVADGLGHGPDAAVAADAAVRSFAGSRGQTLTDRLARLHEALANTRGAAVAIARMDDAAGKVSYSGLGNISAAIARPGETRNLVSLHGTAGRTAGRLTEFTYEWSPECVLVMHSDGLNTRWDLSAYPGLLRRHPSLIAAVLFRDHTRGRDDSCVVVARALPREQS